MLVISANNYASPAGNKWMMPGYQVAAKTGTSSIDTDILH